VRSLAEQVALETRTRALNPKWYEALLEHGYEGVRQIEAQVTKHARLVATTGQSTPWIYSKLTARTFVNRRAMRERLAYSTEGLAKMANRLNRGA
jgi:magnesium chelatase subunit H